MKVSHRVKKEAWVPGNQLQNSEGIQEEKEMSFDLEFCNLDVRRAMNGHPLEARSYRDKEKPALSPTCKIFW